MRGEGGGRPDWNELPEALRDAVGRELGAPVVVARSQAGGFSPGSADRVTTAAGDRAFVKAVDAQRFPGAADLHRRESAVLGLLPADLPVPRLVAVVEVAGWFALVTDDVEGRTPHLPWQRDELDAALAALDALGAHAPAGQLAERLPAADTDLAGDFGGFARLAADPPGDGAAPLDPWVTAHLDELAERGHRGAAAVAGDRLLHTDVRADNLLVRPGGGVVVVDWPWASRGAAFLDPLALLLNARLSGADVDVDALLAEHRWGATDADVTAALAGLTGFCLDAARRPVPEGLPRLRAFQAAQGAAALAWLQERW